MTIVEAARIVIVSSHSEDILRQLCRNVLWLKHGSAVMQGSADEVLAAYRESMPA